MYAYGYARVSTALQSDAGQSLEVQERQILAYASLAELELDHIFVERAVSGSKPLAERPEGAQLLEALSPGTAIIATRLDRMFRDSLDALANLQALKDRDVRLHLIDLGGDVTGGGIAQLVFTILSAVAQAERERIQERIKEVKRDQRSRGRHLGGRRKFGYQIADGCLVPDAREQASIRLARDLRARGYTLRAVASALADCGTPLSRMGVARVLNRDEDDELLAEGAQR